MGGRYIDFLVRNSKIDKKSKIDQKSKNHVFWGNFRFFRGFSKKSIEGPSKTNIFTQKTAVKIKVAGAFIVYFSGTDKQTHRIALIILWISAFVGYYF